MLDQKNGLGVDRGHLIASEADVSASLAETQRPKPRGIRKAKLNVKLFGQCPHCKRNDDLISVGREYFLICHPCRCYWPVGPSMFNGWMLQDAEASAYNAALLATFTKVEPVGMGAA
jgi:hypothetical protein